jgi:hypothetical protein
LVLALVLAGDAATHERQLTLLTTQLGDARAAAIERLHQALRDTERKLRLPILELALPALKQRPVGELTFWHELLTKITKLDAARPLFDFVLLRVLAAYLRASGAPLDAHAGTPSHDAQRRAVRTLLANVAAFGHDEPAAAGVAYATGLRALDWPTRPDDPRFAPLAAARDLDGLDAALTALVALRPLAQQRLLAAVLAVIRADGRLTSDEAELFRTIAAALGCPLPPSYTLEPNVPNAGAPA